VPSLAVKLMAVHAKELCVNENKQRLKIKRREKLDAKTRIMDSLMG